MSPLLFVLLIPLLTAVFCFVSSKSARQTARLGATLNLLLVTGLLARFDPRGAGVFQFPMEWPVIPSVGLNFVLGADGFSMAMLILTAIVTAAAVWGTAPPSKSPGLYYGSVMLIASGVFGAFASVDVFFFYAFHELALIPTFLLIGIWGSGDRQKAAWKATIYLALGSFVLLLGILGLYLSCPVDLRTLTCASSQSWQRSGCSSPMRGFIFCCFSDLEHWSRSSRSIHGRPRPMRAPRLPPPCCMRGF